jgi:hypothetical protein
VQAKLELGDDSEVAAPAAQAPEQLWVLRRAGLDQFPFGGDYVGGEELVDR